MRRSGASALMLVGVIAVAALLRAPITAVPPALADIPADLHLSAAAAGATTSLPLVCFGLFAFLAPLLIGGEVFGWANLPAFFVVCAAAYLFNMGKTIYAGQLPG